MAGSYLIVALCSCVNHQRNSPNSQRRPSDALVDSLQVQAISSDDNEGLAAAHDPLRLLRDAIVQYDSKIHDYRCRFLMQTAKGDRLGDPQEIAVKFREIPYSVDMDWILNPDGASRVTYVAGRWTGNGKQLAMFHPSGVLGVLAPLGVKLDIRSPFVTQDRDHGIDEFGFRNTLLQMVQTCERAVEIPDYSLEVLGSAMLAERNCFVLRRLLPYPDPTGQRNDRMMLMYLDRKWLVPIGCFEYADNDGSRLIGSFVTADVEFNVGLTDADF
ncbi:MAG: DUF1571 domain-containing protein [Planctomycetes bacterium]|nr:DUF1571 domain-containing protein [Planctomycetota bacterium]MBI3836259.1 DUF1571 domain-containing protein [Planctomycetota bacterium]